MITSNNVIDMNNTATDNTFKVVFLNVGLNGIIIISSIILPQNSLPSVFVRTKRKAFISVNNMPQLTRVNIIAGTK